MTDSRSALAGAGRVALFGGAFDPVHEAHLQLARAALGSQALDAVVFLPAAQSPLKDRSPGASARDRLRMLELATRDEARFHVDPVELERGGRSYTVDTVEHFRAGLPRAELFWILGGDQFAQLHRWHRAEKLVEELVFLVQSRPGSPDRAPPLPGLRYRRLEAPPMEASSTEVRSRCAEGRPLKGLVPGSVAAFIRSNKLYTYDRSETDA